MQKLLLFSLLLLFPLLVQAQTWVGGATGDWNVGSNWNSGTVPASGATVIIDTEATIGGTVTNAPAQIQIVGVDVTLDFTGTNDLGDAILINNSSSLTIASDVTFSGTTTTPAIQVEPSGALTVQNTGSLTVSSGSNGILVRGGGAVTNAGTITVDNAVSYGIDLNSGTFTNTGTINIADSGTDGIENSGAVVNSGMITITGAGSRGIYNLTGSFDNNGSITITDAGSVGIRDQTGAFTNNQQITINNPGATTNDGIRTDGNFTNASGGSITVNEVNGDGIAVSAGTLTNTGSLDVTSPSGASGGNDGVSVDPTATLDNNGIVNINGLGTGTRLIRVEGTLSNSGTVTLSGGSTNGRMWVPGGEVTNEIGGELDMGDGQIDLTTAGAALTNNGLLTSTLASGINNSGTATNNGFYSYSGIAAFATGGTVNDLGIDLNDPAETSIDAGGTNTVQIANAGPYTYLQGGVPVGTSDANGNITFMMTLASDPATLTNGLTGVSITVSNLNASALPITLTSFTAKPSGKDVLIEWETATELNNDYMAVERSADGRRFEEIGRVPGAGNSNTLLRYELMDKQPLPGRSYYRLRQVDFDGTMSYSDVRSVSFASAAGGSIQVYPTVSNGKEPLTIALPQTGQQGGVNLDIFHVSGKLVHSVNVSLGRQQQQLQLPELNPGTYLIKSRGERLEMSGRFVILR